MACNETIQVIDFIHNILGSMNAGDKIANLEPTIMNPKVYSYFKIIYNFCLTLNNLHICDTCIKILKYKLNNRLKKVYVVSCFDDLAEIAIGDRCDPDFAFQIIFLNLNTPWGFS